MSEVKKGFGFSLLLFFLYGLSIFLKLLVCLFSANEPRTKPVSLFIFHVMIVMPVFSSLLMCR